MERAGKAGDLEGVNGCIPELELQSALLSKALEQWAGTSAS
jgi:hypothetical protein